MKVSCAVAAAALLVLSVIPVRADVIYPTQRCRVYDDTAFIQIPGQCGTVCRFTRADCWCDLRGGRYITISETTTRRCSVLSQFDTG
jgi:hypothetical protein